MRRVRQSMVTAAIVLSLVLLAATTAAIVIGYCPLGVSPRGKLFQLVSGDGTSANNIWLVRGDISFQTVRNWRDPHFGANEMTFPKHISDWHAFGFSGSREVITKYPGNSYHRDASGNLTGAYPGNFGDIWNITMSLAWPLLLSLPLSAWFFWRCAVAWFLRRRARRPGTCLACGYDLTGNQSGVCPECGTVVEQITSTH